jgi:uncharacterized membrane protein YozB (DUF420 family)
MLAYFSLYYLARGLGALATEGKEGFGGPDWVYHYIFTPILTIHITVVSIGLVLAGYMIILGFRVAVARAGRRVLQSGVLKISPSALMKTAVGSFALFGLLALLRCCSLGRFIVYLSGFLLIMAVLGIEKIIERMIPDGERRHRLIGTFTMILFLVALVTSSATYLMLYVIWAPRVIG